jgi:hypothetical protein
MDNTTESMSPWNMQLTPLHTANTFPPTPTQSFDFYQQPTTLGKRSLPLDLQDDVPQAKRLANFDFPLFPSIPSSASATGSSWAIEPQRTQPTSSFTAEVGLSDEAADVCATWFNKYNVLPR